MALLLAPAVPVQLGFTGDGVCHSSVLPLGLLTPPQQLLRVLFKCTTWAMPALIFPTPQKLVGFAVWTFPERFKCLAGGIKPSLIPVSAVPQPSCVDEYLGIIKRSPSPPQETCRNPPIPDWWVQQPSPGKQPTACVVFGRFLGQEKSSCEGIQSGERFILSSLSRMFEVLTKKSSWELLLVFPVRELGKLGQKMRGAGGGNWGIWELGMQAQLGFLCPQRCP